MAENITRRVNSTGTHHPLAAALCSAVVFGVGCGGGGAGQSSWQRQEQTSQTAGAESTDGRAEQIATGNAAWEQRGDETQLRACITAWQAALATSRADHELWARLARAQYFLADGHMALDPAREEETTAMYRESVTSAEQALIELSPEFAERMQAGARIEEGLPLLDVRAVPALYWRSSALGKWARRDSFATLLSYKDEIRAIMSRVLELDRDYFFAGPDRYFGAFYAVAPAYAGGDLDRSREHFEYSISRHPGAFGTHVLFAVEYATKRQDRALFERELRLVIDGNPDAVPELGPENRAEQRKAQEALARIDELFE